MRQQQLTFESMLSDFLDRVGREMVANESNGKMRQWKLT